MKIWLKYLMGIIIGVAAAILLPAQNPQIQKILSFLFELVVRFGRYTLIPVLFFSVATACFKLNEEKSVIKTGLWTFGIIIVSSALLTLLGIVSALLIKLPQIPVGVETSASPEKISVSELILKLFPYSGFESLLNGTYLLPCFIFAGLAGAGASSERAASKTVFSLFDALSKVCYNVMNFMTEILAVALIAITCKWTVDFISVLQFKKFTPLLLLLTGDFFLVALVIYPLILKFFFKESHPYRVLYAGIAPLFVAFLSADTNLVLPVNMRFGKESLGIKRRINAVSFPLFSIFAKGGVAFVSCVCFVTILRSYSPLEISRNVIFWLGIHAFLLSFIFCEHPTGSAFLCITLLCLSYGGGFREGYLLLKNAAPIICAFATAFDALTALFGSYIVGLKTKHIVRQDIKHFI